MSADIAHSRTRREDAADLRCDGCGARSPVRAPARIHGWQRCAHCGSINRAPWSLAEAYDGPAARTVVLQRRGRAHFIVPRRTLLSTPELLVWLFLITMLSGFAMGFFELGARPHGLWRWLGPLGIALLAVASAALFARRWGSVQHLEVSPKRIRSYRTVGRQRFLVRERSLRGRGLSTRIFTSELDDDTLRSRQRIALAPEGDSRKPLVLVLESEIEARWLGELARMAADPERTRSARCGGCGAPLVIDLERHAAGSVDCSYCQAGFVVAAERLVWPVLEIPLPDDTGSGPSVHVRVSECGGGRRWELLPRQRAVRVLHVLGSLHGVALFVGLGAFMIAVTPQMPEGAIGLRIWGVCAGTMLVAFGGAIIARSALPLFAREALVLDETSFRQVSRIGRWSGSRPLARNERSGIPRAATCVPIARLTGVELALGPGSVRELILSTPHRRLVARWSLPPGESRWLGREILTALAERLAPLGREVRWR